GESGGERDGEVSENADLAGVDYVFAESREIAGPGAARIDRGGHARAAAEIFGIDAERGPAPVDVGAQINQPRSDDEAGYVTDVGFAIWPQSAAHWRHLAGCEGNVDHLIELL